MLCEGLTIVGALVIMVSSSLWTSTPGFPWTLLSQVALLSLLLIGRMAIGLLGGCLWCAQMRV